MGANAWVREMRPTYCEHCGHETEWEERAVEIEVSAIEFRSDGRFISGYIVGSDYDETHEPLERVYETREQADAAGEP